MEISIVFHSPDMPRISPVVRLHWTGSPAELMRLTPPHLHADLPEEACAELIGACVTALQIDPHLMTVSNLPYPPEWHVEGGDRFAWFERLIAEVRAWRPPAVLVNMDPPYEITHGETLIGRWFPHTQAALAEGER